MPYLETAQQWLTQSSLLLKARPSTTRITSKYTISPPSSTPKSATDSTSQPAARATLTLKTYDPQSGTTLKYSTNKGAEVSRLIQILGRLARGMAGLEEKEEVVEEGGKEARKEEEDAPTVVAKGGAVQSGQQGQGGKGKGKKKGKK
ncbi:uncharacterized protein RSE6_00748 [Rhynchosporium secalis]|uniref:SRP9 domain-containing protein n=1 Tax=Rhynchosporium secalis TaxID=38038 RepID=A0A1E1LW36_RHYSE|nr:uncharacterized protein RSE6_00748 [Rhynchosporium secalis]